MTDDNFGTDEFPDLKCPFGKVPTVVQSLAGLGQSSEYIAWAVGVPVDDLLDRWGVDLRMGVEIANGNVAKALFGRATEHGDVKAMMYWLEKNGWDPISALARTGQGQTVLPPGTAKQITSGRRQPMVRLIEGGKDG